MTNYYEGLPSTIRIGFRTFSIVVADMHNLGECDHKRGRIRLSNEHHCQAEAANTVLHEVLHAALEQWNVQERDDHERVVTTTANALCTVMVDNPRLWLWLVERLCRDVKTSEVSASRRVP